MESGEFTHYVLEDTYVNMSLAIARDDDGSALTLMKKRLQETY